MAHLGIDARFCTDQATGIGKHVYELIRHLEKIDSVNRYTIFLKPEIYETFSFTNPRFSKKVTTAPHYSIAEQITFGHQLNREDFDLMIFPHFNAPVLYKKPFVVTIHDLTLHKYPGKKKTGWLARLAYRYIINTITRKAVHCFGVSENTKKDMIEILGLHPDKITVTYNGVSQRFAPLGDKSSQQRATSSQGETHEIKNDDVHKKYHLPSSYFLYTGVMRNHKNILGMIEGYSIFLKKKDQEARSKEQESGEKIPSLVIAGPQDPAYFDEILERCEALGLSSQQRGSQGQEVKRNRSPLERGTQGVCNPRPRIYFPGFIEEADINTVMGQARAFVFPSFYEGFGIPPLEAMQCGVPTITSRTSSLPEACGEATLYFDPHDPNDMARAFTRIDQDEALRQQLIKKGFQQCQKFSWETMAEGMLKVYEQMLKV